MNYVITRKSITVSFGGRSITVDSSHRFYDEIKFKLLEGSLTEEELTTFLDYRTSIEELADGVFSVENGNFVYMAGTDDEIVLHNALTDRILSKFNRGEAITSLINFLKRLLKNPSQESINELFLFLEGNDLPITEDGYFLAYKAVNKDYTDTYSRTYNNSVGSLISMPRVDVNPDRRQTCSFGLHFASLDYVKGNYGWVGDSVHIMVLKIDPADVVSIPEDYNNQKGRCCRYQVVDEILKKNERITTDFAGTKEREQYISEAYDEDEEEFNFLTEDSSSVEKEGMSVYSKVSVSTYYGISKKGWLIGNIPSEKSFNDIFYGQMYNSLKNALKSKKIRMGDLKKVTDVSKNARSVVVVYDDGERDYDGVKAAFRLITPRQQDVLVMLS